MRFSVDQIASCSTSQIRDCTNISIPKKKCNRNIFRDPVIPKQNNNCWPRHSIHKTTVQEKNEKGRAREVAEGIALLWKCEIFAWDGQWIVVLRVFLYSLLFWGNGLTLDVAEHETAGRRRCDTGMWLGKLESLSYAHPMAINKCEMH